jgi:hypothetical protein
MSRSRNRPRDLNQLAKSLVDDATNDDGGSDDAPSRDQVNGRRGGLRGGVARAEKLSPERRSEIARKAAQARWG